VVHLESTTSFLGSTCFYPRRKAAPQLRKREVRESKPEYRTCPDLRDPGTGRLPVQKTSFPQTLFLKRVEKGLKRTRKELDITGMTRKNPFIRPCKKNSSASGSYTERTNAWDYNLHSQSYTRVKMRVSGGGNSLVVWGIQRSRGRGPVETEGN